MIAPILQPTAVLIAWSMIVWMWLYVARLPAMRRAGIDAMNLVGSSGPSLRADLHAKGEARPSWVADNYNHLMEQPTIFYAAALLLAMVGAGGGLNATLAWIYVAFRVAHTLIQATFNRVVVRFALHAVGTIPLLMLAAHAVFAVFGHHHLGVSL